MWIDRNSTGEKCHRCENGLNKTLINKKPRRLNKKTKLVYGVGVNDADYKTNPTINGKRVPCPFYSKWFGMLTRVYDPVYLSRFPTYQDVSIDAEWLTFSRFKAWMQLQDWEGKELDKDLIEPGNKLYKHDKCCFITKRLNSTIISSSSGSLPENLGATYDKTSGKYAAYININGSQKRIGRYKSKVEASINYLQEKIKYMLEIMKCETDPRIKWGIIRHVDIYQERLNYLNLNKGSL